ncbi:MAG: TonB-dependent receptor [Erythrobacter sp.]|uniref:TonB-dependent receptor domain-containing protein n=1 Tax=Erythrobacter sp. TaxID=1042 RepID=UPI0026087697|nr:TonB-dependent receptor [Erythrobacter sp.]MDJ0977192.1 TonB-dependent receptor [Erythrobacter sp.]
MNYKSNTYGRKGFLSASLLSVSGLALMATPLSAQETITSDNEAEEEEQRIVVTGSRIAVDSATALESPVQVITAEQFLQAGEIDITQTLREIPALQGSDPATLDSAQGLALSGASTLNLRSLGSNRTLVLQDGRRHVPGVAGTATVDVGAIPTALIGEVQILTGGASGVYGADAVSGVVNYITRTGRDFDGLEFRLQTGISDEGDAEEFLGSIAGGGTFEDGRGSAVFALEYSHSTSVLAGDRDFAAGEGSAAFGQSNDFLNEQLGLAPGTENAFIPDRTLPVSSTSGIIAIDGFPFDRLAFGPEVATNFNPATDTVPTFTGTDIPILQIIDPETGELRAYNPGISTSAFNASGGDGIPINDPTLTLIPEQTRIVAAAGFDYEIFDNITFFADAKFQYVETTDTSGIPFADDLTLAADNPFLTPQLQSQFDELDASFAGVARDNLASDTGRGTDIERSTIRASGGLRWDSPDSNVTFETSYTWGRTQVDDTGRNQRINDRYFTAIDAVALTEDNVNGTDPIFNFESGSGTLTALRGNEYIEINEGNAQVGDIVCRAEVTGVPAPSNQPFLVGGPPTYEEGTVINGVDVSGRTRPVTFQIGDGTCAPINLIGDFEGQGLEFSFVDINQDTTIEQQQFLAVLSGDTEHLFELPGGPVGFAAGFEWRRDASQFTRDSFESIEGRVIENVNAPLFDSPENGETIRVWELFGEVRLPVLGGIPFVENLEFTAAGRYSDYNTIGTTETYSFGAQYSPVDWLTFRGTLSRAIRAPNISELYAPQGVAQIGVDADPCDDGNINNGSSNRVANCLTFVDEGFDSANFLTAFSTGTDGGNPNLTEETSDSFTIGGIFQPRGILGGALDNLVLIVDYYDIEIEDAIGSLTGQQIAEACVDLPSTDNQFCDAIERDPNRGGAIVGFTSGNINLEVLRARGVDFEARYAFDAPFGDGDWGMFMLRAAGTRFLERFTEGDPVIQQTIADETDPLQQQLLIVDQGSESDLLGVIGVPEWIVNFSANWKIDRLNIGWRTRWEDSSLQISNGDATDAVIIDGQAVLVSNEGVLDESQLNTGDGFEHDINITFEATDRLQVFGGVNNLFDAEPFLGSLSRPVSPRGRFFFLGLTGSF